MVLKLYISRTADGEGLPFPNYVSKHHVALNLQAAVTTPIRLNHSDRAYIPVGFAIGIPDGFCGQVVSLPSVAKEQGLVVLDGPQILHPADRKPLYILLQNTAPKAVVVHRGLICAQLLITPVEQVYWQEVKASVSDLTLSSDIVLQNTSEESETKPALKFSRRKVRSIRDRYKADEDENTEE